MKRRVFLLLAAIAPYLYSPAQEMGSHSYRNFPLIISIQFHALSLPLKDLKANFSNPGIGVGTEFSYSGNQNWVQQVNVIWYRNRYAGSGILLITQAVWRPSLGGNSFAEVKAGIGYSYSFRPVESYYQENEVWKKARHKGKSMFVIPVGLSAGFDHYSGGNLVSPFVSYQFLLLSGYNKSIPLVPETLLQAGTSVHFQ
jgi:hypothetical protein